MLYDVKSVDVGNAYNVMLLPVTCCGCSFDWFERIIEEVMVFLLHVVMMGSVEGRLQLAASEVLIASDDGTAWQIAYGAETTIESRA